MEGRVGEDGRLLSVISQSLSFFAQPLLRQYNPWLQLAEIKPVSLQQ